MPNHTQARTSTSSHDTQPRFLSRLKFIILRLWLKLKNSMSILQLHSGSDGDNLDAGNLNQAGTEEDQRSVCNINIRHNDSGMRNTNAISDVHVRPPTQSFTSKPQASSVITHDNDNSSINASYNTTRTEVSNSHNVTSATTTTITHNTYNFFFGSDTRAETKSRNVGRRDSLRKSPRFLALLPAPPLQNPKKFIFDLGVRKDSENYPPAVVECWMKVLFPCQVPKDLVDCLAKGGYVPDDIDYICLSHLHFDHVGDPSLFPKSKFLVGAQGNLS
ncbi:hypothetical protein D9758_013392 [Tetrapyrgos nigripes]|uniref:Metallo-beta-lactamase domain-containing protein n=1 Tax=Tetrapyrgos nigripes TaxID=182062 RepID=A0A8H5CKZ3_9AGAR|nr:hypothetical protein D9758_013392 [Tetrapyrgos nigripes]